MKRRITALLLACALLLALCAHAETEMPAVDMLEVDHKLYELGYRDSACNGVLDEVTINALRNFQLANDLVPTGEPDDETLALLLSGGGIRQSDYLNALAQQNAGAAALANGAYGDAVLRLQRALQELGYLEVEANGEFSEETQYAVCRFQLANGLRVSGVADGSVLLRLYQGAAGSWMDFLNGCCSAVGAQGETVRTVQLWLKRMGIFTGECTGRFGDATQQAVKRFQNASGLDVSGEVDLETAVMLFADMRLALPGGTALFRGCVGAEAELLCQQLAKLGYPAHARFNMQTELALMQFQYASNLEVTGIADELTRARLRGDNAPRRESVAAMALSLPQDDEARQRLSRRAELLLGQQSEFDSEFGLIQYVCLKCGAGLPDFSRLQATPLDSADALRAGEILGITVSGREVIGIASADFALIYRAESGYIVKSYLEAIKPESLRLYRPAE